MQNGSRHNRIEGQGPHTRYADYPAGEEGGPYIACGAIGPGGRLPVNISGGRSSGIRPGMTGIFKPVTAARHLRGQCGEYQVKDVEIALTHGNGGQYPGRFTALPGTEEEL